MWRGLRLLGCGCCFAVAFSAGCGWLVWCGVISVGLVCWRFGVGWFKAGVVFTWFWLVVLVFAFLGCCAICRFCCLIVTFSLPVGDFIGLAWFAGGFWVYFKVVLAWCFGVVLGCR